jgi:hypothetical protein
MLRLTHLIIFSEALAKFLVRLDSGRPQDIANAVAFSPQITTYFAPDLYNKKAMYFATASLDLH